MLHPALSPCRCFFLASVVPGCPLKTAALSALNSSPRRAGKIRLPSATKIPPMPLLFAYGSLKQGFANAQLNPGRRVPGQYRARERFPLYLLGDGEVPGLFAPPGSGHQVIGELYEVNDEEFQRLDRLERVGEPEGYERVQIAVERFDLAAVE